MFAKVGEVLRAQGLKVGTGTIVDATRALFVDAPAGSDVWAAFAWCLGLIALFGLVGKNSILLVDRTKETYRALEMKKGNLWDVMGPKNWARYAKGILSGHGVDKPKQDPLQMGGVLVVDTDGAVKYEFRAGAAKENPPIDEVLAALP